MRFWSQLASGWKDRHACCMGGLGSQKVPPPRRRFQGTLREGGQLEASLQGALSEDFHGNRVKAGGGRTKHPDVEVGWGAATTPIHGTADPSSEPECEGKGQAGWCWWRRRGKAAHSHSEPGMGQATACGSFPAPGEFLVSPCCWLAGWLAGRPAGFVPCCLPPPGICRQILSPSL